MKRVDGFVSERLTQAREAHGLTKAALSGMLEISPNALTALETGTSLPRAETFEAIAEKTSFPRQFFLRPAPYERAGILAAASLRTTALPRQNGAENRMGRRGFLCSV
jgi:transcriptional regulator with XRE-family HTH domain